MNYKALKYRVDRELAKTGRTMHCCVVYATITNPDGECDQTCPEHLLNIARWLGVWDDAREEYTGYIPDHEVDPDEPPEPNWPDDWYKHLRR